ncbi:MAG TPA: hypothetical protein VHJ99_13830 [Candidatus Dormibacteraeota bacterium]|nr:hypothetical protein [Candidatus Dormibacteraeota bacterium]
MSIYADLLEFKRGILDRVVRDLASLQALARKAAAADVQIIEDQMQGYQARLDLWYKRIWKLHGLWLDPEGRMIRHQGREVALTLREFQLLQFLLDHPHRFRRFDWTGGGGPNWVAGVTGIIIAAALGDSNR